MDKLELISHPFWSSQGWSPVARGLPILEPSALSAKLRWLYLYPASGSAPSGALFQSC